MKMHTLEPSVVTVAGFYTIAVVRCLRLPALGDGLLPHPGRQPPAPPRTGTPLFDSQWGGCLPALGDSRPRLPAL